MLRRVAGHRRAASGAAVAFVAAALLCGCWPDSSGIDPPGNRFFFPTGIALTPDGRRLLVANSNFDLRYNAGTVVAVRVRDDGEGVCCDGSTDGCETRCVDSEIERCSGRCTDARDETPFLAVEETVVIGSGATDLAVAPGGGRAYVTVRGDGSLVYIDLDASALETDRAMSCNRDATSRRCDGLHTIVRTGDLWLPPEPYSILVDDSWIILGHVTSGNVSLLRVNADGPPTLERVVDSFPTGTNGLARHPAIPWYYLVSRDSRQVYPFSISDRDWRPGEGPAVSVGRTIPLDVNDTGSDSRFIAFSPTGDRAYVTNRSPSSLVVVDTTPHPDGSAEGRAIETIEIGAGTSKVAVQPIPDGYLVLAVCFDAERIYVVDPALRAVVGEVRTGTGPFAIATDPDPARARAYIANFGESSVWVVDLDPASAYFTEPILKIGLPERPASND